MLGSCRWGSSPAPSRQLPACKHGPDQHLGPLWACGVCSRVRPSFLQGVSLAPESWMGISSSQARVSMTRDGFAWKNWIKECVLRPRSSPNTNQHWLLPECCLWSCWDFCPFCRVRLLLPRRKECVRMTTGEGVGAFSILTLRGVKNPDCEVHRSGAGLAFSWLTRAGQLWAHS